MTTQVKSSSSDVRVALIQLECSTSEPVYERVPRAIGLIGQAAQQADMVMLPELWHVGAFDVEAGDRVGFVQVEPGRFELIAATRSVRELKGRFGKPDRTVSIEEMNTAIAEQATRTR